jgi:ankyrin repeat protein
MIHRSVDRDDLPGVRTQVEAGVSLEATDYRKRTPLQLAADQERMEIVRYLVLRGAEIDAPTPEKTGEVTPLRYAISNGDIEMVLFLIEHGADVNKANNQGWTPLMTAVTNGYSDIVDILIAEGADINARTARGRTMTRIASDAGYTDLVLKLTLLMQE